MMRTDPLDNLSIALSCAVGLDLLPVEAARGAPERRPRREDCEVYLFPQGWAATVQNGAAALGPDDTVVVVGPRADACVYFGGMLAYHLEHPNRRFFLDLAARDLRPAAQAGCYEGMDDDSIQSASIAMETDLAHLLAAVREGDPASGPWVAKLLRDFACRFDATRQLQACAA
ncbi:MAG: hypothetical protein JNJ60_04815 [Rhodocyclaceae bacterium]|nr:hypothetical protein [Rhodocyclaceae bacterium]